MHLAQGRAIVAQWSSPRLLKLSQVHHPIGGALLQPSQAVRSLLMQLEKHCEKRNLPIKDAFNFMKEG